jgi:hypothetical protein
VASFTGIARAEHGQTTTLELEAYPGFTEAAIGQIAEEAKARFGLHDFEILHRIGRDRAGRADRLRGHGGRPPPRRLRGLRLPDGLPEEPRALLEEGARPGRRPLGRADGRIGPTPMSSTLGRAPGQGELSRTP